MALRSVLSAPWAFDLYQRLIGAPNCHRHFIERYARPRAGDKIIDFGCGLGASLRHLPPDITYVGLDASGPYIDKARERFGDRGTFLRGDLETVDLAPLAPFDLGISFGVVHHLEDRTARALARRAKEVIQPGGHLATIDPVYSPSMSAVARFLIDHDRGSFPRDEAAYRTLFEPYGKVETDLVQGVLRIPYQQLALVLTV